MQYGDAQCVTLTHCSGLREGSYKDCPIMHLLKRDLSVYRIVVKRGPFYVSHG